ncbi:MAG: N-formylglutamate amidohydrolase [Gemmatimonadetes bacterium]|nr:N-formylglutamate amidohydrolase [Gemmatimonadota bacterium]
MAVALHDAHAVRREVARRLLVDPETRRREEDPYTAEWVSVAPTRVVATRSRFELDLNRARSRAIYRHPEEAWGISVWKEPIPAKLIERSLENFDAFYKMMYHTLRELEERFGHFLVIDLHSYCHRRGGPDAPPDAPELNPHVSIGTGNMDRDYWAPVVDRFCNALAEYDYPGGRLDVGENVRFSGGYFGSWVHNTFPKSGCSLLVEVKKFFMNEWTGEPDWDEIRNVGDAFASIIPGVVDELAAMSAR